MPRSYRIPGGAFITETGARSYRVPGSGFVRETLSVASAILVRALLIKAGKLKQITDAEKGTGEKPLVLINGVLKQRVASEGVPVILDNGKLRTLGTNETLLS